VAGILTHGWVNIYKSGKYHTPGKPGAYDRHAGDIYSSHAQAWQERDLSEEAGYLDTVPVTYRDEQHPKVNQPRS
jgi:hypothetical protein